MDFKDKMDILLQAVSNTKDISMIIFYSTRVGNDYGLIAVLIKFIEKWSTMYNKEQTRNSYKLITNGRRLSFDLDSQRGIRRLVETQIQEFIIYRDPILLSKAKTEHPEAFLKSIYFINIGKLLQFCYLLDTNLLLQLNRRIIYANQNCHYTRS